MTVFTPIRTRHGYGLPADNAAPMFARVHPHTLAMPASGAPATARNGADRRALSIGLMGGSFNPAHDGHRHVAELALKRLALDEVWWLVSPQNPLKPRGDMAPFAERLASARALARHPRIKPSDVETRLGTQFTADTLVELRRRCPHMRFVWIMGADNLIGFHRWERWSLILHTTVIAVFDRPSYSLRALASLVARRYAKARVPFRASRTLANRRPPAWVFLHTPRHSASATRIRETRATGQASNHG
ncbi:MAG: nicotinate-nucleotide adenylyltransferase [Alphaproteobacteria bacterium]|nr:nicotinate-nucleotide adenylyltransferase [Alphaproteobacteria bacterium]